jgi:hypothetical protein
VHEAYLRLTEQSTIQWQDELLRWFGEPFDMHCAEVSKLSELVPAVRVAAASVAGGRTAIMQVPYLMNSFLFDYGSQAVPRVTMVSRTQVVGDIREEIETLFTDGWDSRSTAIIEHEPPAAGDAQPLLADRRQLLRPGQQEPVECPVIGRRSSANLAGKTNTMLLFTNLQTTDAGNYTVVVTNAVGSVTSAVATLARQQRAR